MRRQSNPYPQQNVKVTTGSRKDRQTSFRQRSSEVLQHVGTQVDSVVSEDHAASLREVTELVKFYSVSLHHPAEPNSVTLTMKAINFSEDLEYDSTKCKNPDVCHLSNIRLQNLKTYNIFRSPWISEKLLSLCDHRNCLKKHITLWLLWMYHGEKDRFVITVNIL